MFDQFPKVKLSEICSINIGGTPAREVAKFWAESHDGVAWVSIADMKQKYISKTKEYISKSGALSSNVKLIPADSLLMSFKLTVGKVAINTVDLYCNEAIAFFNPLNDSVSLDWLFHVLPLVTANTVTDTAVKGATLNKEKINNLDIPLPEIAVQRKIVKVLDTLDLEIEQTKGIIGKLENSKAGLLNDLLTCGVDSHENLRPSYEDAPDLYQETELGFIPKEWEILSVSDFSDFVTSGSRGWASYYAESGALFIRIGNLSRENLDMRFESVVYVNPPKSADGLRTKLQEGDILVSITADLGIIGVVPKNFGDAFINQHIALVRPKEGFNSRFIGYYLASFESQKQIETYNDGGAKAGLNLPTIRNLKVALPNSISEQNAIAEKLDAINSQILSSKNELNKLEQIKIGLLKDLLQN